MRQLCECGCGKEVTNEGNRFLIGHNQRGKPSWMKGKTHTGEAKARMSSSHLGKTFSEEHKSKISTSNLGKVSWIKGKTHSEATKAKISASKLGKKREPFSEEWKAKIGAASLGRTPSEETKKKMSENNAMKRPEVVAKTAAAIKCSLKDWGEKCPLLFKVEEMKEENGKIWGHCTNHNCPNSKENNGWFILTGNQISYRIRELNNGDDHSNFYCSDQCKKTCTKFNKSAAQLIRQDEIVAGHIKELPYTSAEYEVFKQEVLKRDNYKCIYCGEPAEHVHHTRPQKLEPFFVLDPDYSISCCTTCHYKYGHKTDTDCSTSNLANRVCN